MRIDCEILPSSFHLINGLLDRTAKGPFGDGLVLAYSYSSTTKQKTPPRHDVSADKVRSADASEEIPFEIVEVVAQR
ncbi:MAG: hypothetical protein VKO39_10710 [Cyanobacteriota bacterium]|nr:hypothetical protein [Cyanobacteriota bacterium]